MASPDFITTGHKNSQQLIHFRSRFKITDFSEISLPIHIRDEMIADDVQVVINGLYHPNAGDLNITLRHNGKLSSLISKRQDGKSIGFPRGRFSPGYKETEQDEFGLGQQFIFRDPQAENMALHKNASQSSTLYSAEATRAVDGIVDGRLSHESLSHTDKDINSWLQVDLGENQTIGIVKLWNREAEILVHEIQRIWTQAFSAMHGTFRLQLGYQGINATTGNIHHNAVPRIENEIGLPGSGAGQGESMQSMIQSLSNIGQVEVSRVGPTRFDEFEWRVSMRENGPPFIAFIAFTNHKFILF